MSTPDLLPVCTAREIRGRIQINGVWHIPLYCMNCGRQHGYRNEPDAGSGYVGYLCEPCAEHWSPLAGAMLVPDIVHAELVAQEMLDAYGRVLTDAEQARVLDDSSSTLTKLARDRPVGR